MMARLRRTRNAAIRELRLGFVLRGFDVSAFSDDDVGHAVLDVANPHTRSSTELFARAVDRLRTVALSQVAGLKPRAS